VLFCNDLGADPNKSSNTVPYSGRSTFSVKEAVGISTNNNFMGLICRQRLLVSLSRGFSESANNLQSLAPALIDTIKTVGLVLISDISGSPLDTDAQGGARQNTSLANRIVLEKLDGTVRGNGVLLFTDSVDV
jgi:CDK inhibitor PHO81